jgi:DNA polymerase I-like protein with 3'-5' exonuclease and polymerase domains
MSLLSLDIETKCGLGCEGKCLHGLDEYRNVISVVGVVSANENKVFRAHAGQVDACQTLRDFVGSRRLVFHNGKFDLKTLAVKGLDLSANWEDDTLLMAATLTEKVSFEYLQWYEAERARLNEKLPRGYSHRKGSPHSLKTLAPYFLGVPAFWETPTNHDSDEYVLKDCEYTLRLAHVFETKLRAEGTYEFYKNKLLPWTRLLLKCERRGIKLDSSAMLTAETEAHDQALQARRHLDELWAPHYRRYAEIQREELREKYEAKKAVAIEKAKDKGKTAVRYDTLFSKAAAKVSTEINLDSPTQLSWLLKSRLQLDITDFDGEETTGKAVLEKLASEGRTDVAEFLRYRKARKLSTAFFPSYREMMWQGALHCSFNPTGTRTGRLSSSGPNLQQVPKGIHNIFVARPGYKLATYDESAIEPRLIAYYSHDLNLYDILSQGKDFHNYNTGIFFDLNSEDPDFKKKYPKERDVGKEVALALMYGAGVNRLMESAQKRGFVWTKKEAFHKLSRFKEFYEGVYTFREEVVNRALATGAIKNLFGRAFMIEDPADIHMQGLNTLVQGTASDLVLESAYRAQAEFEKRNIDAHVLLLVHDEIVVEIPEDREAECVSIITKAMTDYSLPTPLGPIELKVEGKVAPRWEK